MKLNPFLLSALVLLLLVSPAFGQDVPTCPPAVLIDLARASSTCYGLQGETVCVGNGSAQVGTFAAESATALPGDRAPADTIHELRVTSTEDELGIAHLTIRADLPTLQERAGWLMLFGNAELTNLIPPLVTLNAISLGTLNVRQAADASAAILARLGVNEGVVVSGRTADGTWLRVQVPNTDEYGWIAAELVTVSGSVSALAVADGASIIERPFARFTLHSDATAFCGGALTSGLLLQTPNVEQPVRLRVNGVNLTLAGTFFLTADGALTVYALNGLGLVSAGEVEEFLPAGTYSTAIGETISAAAPYAPAIVNGLPVANLPTRVTVAEPLSAEGIAAARAAYIQSQVEAAVTPEVRATEDTTCRRTVQRFADLYGGPGDFYEVVASLQTGERVDPLLQTTDPDGYVWWQLRSGSWLRADRVAVSGLCAELPFVDNVRPPGTNTLSLETCEPINGPLRAGQRVTIQFTPPAFDNFGEARDAAQIDPGRIRIASHTYRAQASEPIRLGTADDRYVRCFYIIWEAAPGTYRIEGDRLHYSPVCTVTVPVG